MALIDINWYPSSKELRVFAVLLALFGALIAWMTASRLGTTVASVALFAFWFLAAMGLVRPLLLRPVYVVWMALAFPIGWTVSHLLMAIVFFLVVTPIGVIMRLFGRDPLERRFHREAGTYWKRRDSRQGTRSYFRQY